jgi:hypothetical protein
VDISHVAVQLFQSLADTLVVGAHVRSPRANSLRVR